MTLTIYPEMEQGSSSWLAARAGIVTASTVGQLITPKTVKPAANDTARGLYATLIAERVTGCVEPVIPNRAMTRGTLLEPHARAEYVKVRGPVTEVGFARLDTDTFMLGASPDGLIGDDGGLEIKSPSSKVFTQTVISGEVPLYNLAQVQASLLVTSRAWWDFVSYYPGQPLFIKRVYPDPKWHDAITTACVQFETAACTAAHAYETATRGLPATEYVDPFDEGEEIF